MLNISEYRTTTTHKLSCIYIGEGGASMGLAKYMEDNIEIFNNRMYEKGIGLMHLGGFKKTRKRKTPWFY